MVPALRKRPLHVDYYPRYQSDIFVLWKIYSGLTWWRASVLSLHVITDRNRKNVVAEGEICYSARDGYAQETVFVEFLFATGKDRILRTKGSNKARGNTWSFQCDVTEMEISKRLLPSTHQPVILNNNNLGSSHSISIPKESSPFQRVEDNDEDTLPSPSRNSNIPTDIVPSNDGIINNSSLKGISHMGSSAVHEGQTVSNIVSSDSDVCHGKEIKMLKARVKDLEGKVLSLQVCNSIHDEYLHSLVSQLRHQVMSKCQAPFKPNGKLTSGTEGLSPSSIVISASCTLSLFSRFASFIQGGLSNTSSDNVHFFPSFRSTQSPSTASSLFLIYFTYLKDMMNVLGIRDSRDYVTMVFRKGIDKRRPFLRVLGTYYRNVRGEDSHVETDHLLVGCSIPSVDDSVPQWEEKEGDHSQICSELASSKLHIEMCRERSMWDEHHGRFLNKWTGRSNTKAPEDPRVDDIVEKELMFFPHAFQIVWKCTTSPSRNYWTSDALRTDNIVLGTIQLILPSVLVYGPFLCKDIYQIVTSSGMFDHEHL